jgi:hypothetical protein
MSIESRPEAPTHHETSASVSLGAVATKILPFPDRSTSNGPKLRKSDGLDGVLPIGHEWIAGLPPGVRPLRLAMQYPRLVNLIALEWNNPPVAGTLLTEVLNHDRGDLGGFPAVVFAELRELHDHYFKVALAERATFREFEAIAAGESWDWGPTKTCESRPAPMA